MKRIILMILTIGLFTLGQSAQAQWQATKRITWTSGSSEWPVIAVDPSGNPHVVWSESVPGEGNEIFYKKSTDGGAAWTPAKRLTWSSDVSDSPVITVDASGNPHLVWIRFLGTMGTQIHYKNSSDGGTSWTATKRLTWTSSYCSSPSIAVDASSNLHLVWSRAPESGGREVYYKKSSDGGASWTSGKRLTWTSGSSESPAIAVDPSGNPHIAWKESLGTWPDNQQEVFYKMSSDGGTTWTANKRLTWTSGNSVCPDVFVDAIGNVHVVWSEDVSEDYNYEICYKKSPDGTAWTAIKRLTWTPQVSLYPGIGADPAGNVYVVWEEDLDYTEIYYKKSTNGGSTWSRTWNISWTSGDSYEPNVVLDSSGHLHVVWYDSTPGNYEIYYKKRE